MVDLESQGTVSTSTLLNIFPPWNWQPSFFRHSKNEGFDWCLAVQASESDAVTDVEGVPGKDLLVGMVYECGILQKNTWDSRDQIIFSVFPVKTIGFHYGFSINKSSLDSYFYSWLDLQGVCSSGVRHPVFREHEMKRFVSIPEHPRWRCEGKKPLVVKEKVNNKKDMLGLYTGLHYAVIGLKQAIIMISTVDGRNPAPVYRYFYPTI